MLHTVELLEFHPRIYILNKTISKIFLNTFMKIGMVCNTPYTNNKQSSMRINSSVNNQIIAQLV